MLIAWNGSGLRISKGISETRQILSMPDPSKSSSLDRDHSLGQPIWGHSQEIVYHAKRPEILYVYTKEGLGNKSDPSKVQKTMYK